MFKNLKDLINTRKKLEFTNLALRVAKSNVEDYNSLLNTYALELERKEAQLAKIEIVILNRKETLKGLNQKLIEKIKPTQKKATPKKAAKKN